MTSLIGYLTFQILPAAGSLLFTAYLAYIVTNPVRLKAKMSKRKGISTYDVYSKLYNRQFLGAWICITLFFVTNISYDLYRSMHTPSIVLVYLKLALTLSLIFVGGTLMTRALKRK